MKRRGVTIWLVVIIVLILAFIIPSPISRKSNNLLKKIGSPVSRPMVIFGHKFADFFSLFFEIGDLRSSNERLADDLVKSKVDNAKLNQLQIENDNLKQLLEYKNAHPNMKLVLANVVGLDPTNYYGTLVVDKGLSDGVAAGMAVTSLGVLVGKIDQVNSNTSRVLLVTSKDSIVQVMLESSRTTGVLRGGISGMTLGSVPLDTSVGLNENIITSGLGGNLPKGIFVGTASDEVSVKSDIFKTINVKSPINFTKLEYLFIATGV